MEPPVLSWYDRWVGPLTVGVLTALAVLTALFAIVLMPPSAQAPDPSLYPRIAESLLLAGPGLFFISLYAGRAGRLRMAAFIPGIVWLSVVLIVGAGTPDGDNPYLLSSVQGLLLAPVGMTAAALGAVKSRPKPARRAP